MSMDPVSGRAHKFLISFVLLTNFILRGVDVHTILTDPQLSPNNVECVPQDMDTDRSTSICDDVHIVEFGPCGSVVKLNKDLVYRKTLRIYFETIFEAADVAESIIKPKPESMYAAVLLRENKFIEWIVLFLKLDYLIDGRLLMGSHTVLPLWHYTKLSMGEQIKSVELKSEMAEKEQSNGTTWMLYVLLLSDHRNLPLDCGDPPTMFDVKWIDQSKAVILGAAKYTVVDKITDGDD